MKSLVTSTQKGWGPIIRSAPSHRSDSKIIPDNRRLSRAIAKYPINAVTGKVDLGS
jgi:hypothetical protein